MNTYDRRSFTGQMRCGWEKRNPCVMSRNSQGKKEKKKKKKRRKEKKKKTNILLFFSYVCTGGNEQMNSLRSMRHFAVSFESASRFFSKPRTVKHFFFLDNQLGGYPSVAKQVFIASAKC